MPLVKAGYIPNIVNNLSCTTAKIQRTKNSLYKKSAGIAVTGEIEGIFVDGRKDLTVKLIRDKDNGRTRRKIVRERSHIT